MRTSSFSHSLFFPYTYASISYVRFSRRPAPRPPPAIPPGRLARPSAGPPPADRQSPRPIFSPFIPLATPIRLSRARPATSLSILIRFLPFFFSFFFSVFFYFIYISRRRRRPAARFSSYSDAVLSAPLYARAPTGGRGRRHLRARR